MKTELILIGKTNDKLYVNGINDYTERITHYMPFGITTIPAIKNTKSLSEEQQKQMEGEQILKLIQASDTVVLLDEKGAERTSLQMATWLEKRQQTARRLIFIIGGPYGFSEAVYKRANELISLSKMTFSHQMVRLIFTEQLYTCHDKPQRARIYARYRISKNTNMLKRSASILTLVFLSQTWLSTKNQRNYRWSKQRSEYTVKRKSKAGISSMHLTAVHRCCRT